MKIELIKLKFNDTCSYKYKHFDFCCEAIQNNKAIVFTDEDLFDYSQENNNANLPQFCTSYTETYTSWEDEFEQVINYPIKFCPHCREKIEITLEKEIDVADKYDELSKQRDKLWNKYKKIDSKKKEAELKEQIKNLDNQINNFYVLNEYDERM